MYPLRHLIPAAALAALAAAQPAQAGTLVLKPCYRSVDEVNRETVRVDVDGFTPGAAVDVAIDGTVVQAAVVAQPDGSVRGDVTAPYQASGQRPFTVSVTEREEPANAASATSVVAALGFRLKPREAAPSRRVRFIGLGFTDGPEVFGHYVQGGKLRETVSMGPPQGPCGRVNVRRRQIPVERPRTGRGSRQVDNQAVYTPEPVTVVVRMAITVKRVPRAPR